MFRRRITFSIPTTYTDITIGQAMGWARGKDMEERVAGITGVDIALVKKLPMVEVQAMHDKFNALLDVKLSAFKRHLYVKVEGKRRRVPLAFIPDMYRMTRDEYVDLINWCNNGVEKNLHKIAATLYRPIDKKIGNKYTIIPYTPTDRAMFDDAMKAMPLVYINGAIAFFLNLRPKLAESSQKSFQSQLAQTITELTGELRESLTPNQ